MCGFAGELARRRACDVDAVERMAQALAPRGPDGSGSWSAGPSAVALLAEAGQTDLATFSVGFDDAGTQDGDEFAFSDRVAQQFSTDHHRWRVDTTAIVDALPAAIFAMSEPMVSHDAIGFYLLAEQVARTHKVVQCGQGADEIFAGYSWYPPLQEAQGLGADAYAREFFDRPHAEMADLLTDAMIGAEDPSTAWVQEHFGRPGADTPVDRALRLDTQTMLVDDPVKRVDNMTMAWGLEARTPFLDHELVELAAACPPQHKLAGGGKGVLKQACRGLLPDEIIDRRKGYFPVPALSHLEEPVLGLVGDALHSERARSRGVLRPEYVERMLAAPNDHHTTLEGSKLWQVGLLELWLQEHGL